MKKDITAFNNIKTVHCNLCGSNKYNFLYENNDRLYKFPGLFKIVKCSHCGVVYLKQRPNDIGQYYPKEYSPHVKENNDFYTKLFEDLHKSYYGDYKKKWKRLKSLLCQLIYRPIPKELKGNILDIGCGSGFYLWMLKQCGWNVYGVDISKNATDFAIKRYGLSNIYNGELEQGRYPDVFFDVVTLNHTIEHMPDPVSKVNEIFRITKPGGLVSVTTQNVDSLNRKIFGKFWFPFETPRHLFLFSPRTLSALFNQNGFKPVKIHHDISTDSLRTSIQYKFHKDLGVLSKLFLGYTIATSLIGVSDAFTAFFIKKVR